MNELCCLLGLELRALWGINRFLHTRDKKEKNRLLLLGVVWAVLMLLAFAYVGGLVLGLCFLGLEEIVPAYLAALASLLILAFGIFTAGNRIFGRKGYDLLAALPVKPEAIVISRFLSLYTEDLLFALAIMVPGAAVYGLCTKPGLGFYLTALLGSLFIPAIPLVISVLVGTVVFSLSARLKNKSLVQSLLMVALVVAILVGSFNLEGAMTSITPEAIANLAQTMADLFGRIYPPALWLGDAMVGTAPLGLGLFVLISMAVMALAIGVVAKNFHGILGRLGNYAAKQDYKIQSMESRSLLKALWLREMKRYFSSSIYVTNTIIGPILGMLLAVALCVTGPETLRGYLGLPVDILGLLPFLFAGVFCMMTTSSVSISMEGKQFWVVKSLPIPAKTLLDSKILLNLSLMAPCYLISLVAMAVALKPGPLELVWLALIPASVMMFSVVFGITVNLKFHSFDWEREETVVKQSLSALVGGFSGFLLAVVLGIAAFSVPPQLEDAARALMCLVVLGVTALLYRQNNKTRLELL